MSDLIPLGLYRHYKGKDYSVLGFAKDSETGQLMVLYVPLYGEGGYWVRPLSMFTEEVENEGKFIPRFTFIGNSEGVN
jgi:cyclomaltodextrinase